MPAIIRVLGRGSSTSSSKGEARPSVSSSPPPAPGRFGAAAAISKTSNDARSGAAPQTLPRRPAVGGTSRPKKEPELLFQKQFKSVGPRTYEAEVMRAGNGNHYIVMSEGKPDATTGEMRKTRLFIFSEDFDPFWDLMRDVARFVKENPLPAEIQQKRKAYWTNPKPRPVK